MFLLFLGFYDKVNFLWFCYGEAPGIPWGTVSFGLASPFPMLY